MTVLPQEWIGRRVELGFASERAAWSFGSKELKAVVELQKHDAVGVLVEAGGERAFVPWGSIGAIRPAGPDDGERPDGRTTGEQTERRA